jgi:hypothetical protein
MNRPTVIDQLEVTQETLGKLLAVLESSEPDKFVAHLYQAGKQYRLVCERPNKGNKAIERQIIASFQIAQSPASRETSSTGSTCCGFRVEIFALKHHVLRNQSNGKCD